MRSQIIRNMPYGMKDEPYDKDEHSRPCVDSERVGSIMGVQTLLTRGAKFEIEGSEPNRSF